VRGDEQEAELQLERPTILSASKGQRLTFGRKERKSDYS